MTIAAVYNLFFKSWRFFNSKTTLNLNEGVGITVTNWDLTYKTRVCKVERGYRFERV